MDTIVFSSPEFGELRITQEKGILLFCISDICQSLNIEDGKALCQLGTGEIFNVGYLPENSQSVKLFTSLDGLIDIAGMANYSLGRKYRKWVMTDILPKANVLLCNNGNTLKLSEVMACIKDVIIDYPLCAIESDDADMDQVHYNISILSRFYFSMTSGSSTKESNPISPICK